MRKEILLWVVGMIFLGHLCFAQPAPVVEVQKILVSPASGTANLGELVNFQVIVTNVSAKNIVSLTISDTYDKVHLDYIGAEPEPDYIDESTGFLGFNNFITRFGQLAPGRSFTISVTFRAIAIPGVVPFATNSVTVSGYDEDTIPFSHGTVTANVSITQKCAPDFYEPNESLRESALIKVCKPIRAYLCPEKDSDFFQVLLDQDGYYTFKLYHLPGNYDLYLYEAIGAGPIA